MCQLDPIDSLLFTATIRQIGKSFEARRSPKDAQRVFSYRFGPDATGRLYEEDSGWDSFWTISRQRSAQKPYTLILDITDFYNQIYHHVLENQLAAAGIERATSNAILNLLKKCTEKVSRGIPVGPHASHLLAELSLIPLDDFMLGLGVEFCRFVDDIHLFCESRKDAHRFLREINRFVNETQKLVLNGSKTLIVTDEEFQTIAATRLMETNISLREREILKIIKVHAPGPYTVIKLAELSDQEMKSFTKRELEGLLDEYLAKKDVDYTRLRWLFRRLAQVGAPGGVEYVVNKLDDLTPAIQDASRYLGSAIELYSGNSKEIGRKLVDALDSELIDGNEYLETVLISLFTKHKGLNNLNELTKNYDTRRDWAKREIILAMGNSPSGAGWISSQKGRIDFLDAWSQRALLHASRVLPGDERRIWLKGRKKNADLLSLLLLDN